MIMTSVIIHDKSEFERERSGADRCQCSCNGSSSKNENNNNDDRRLGRPGQDADPPTSPSGPIKCKNSKKSIIGSGADAGRRAILLRRIGRSLNGAAGRANEEAEMQTTIKKQSEEEEEEVAGRGAFEAPALELRIVEEKLDHLRPFQLGSRRAKGKPIVRLDCKQSQANANANANAQFKSHRWRPKTRSHSTGAITRAVLISSTVALMLTISGLSHAASQPQKSYSKGHEKAPTRVDSGGWALEPEMGPKAAAFFRRADRDERPGRVSKRHVAGSLGSQLAEGPEQKEQPAGNPDKTQRDQEQQSPSYQNCLPSPSSSSRESNGNGNRNEPSGANWLPNHSLTNQSGSFTEPAISRHATPSSYHLLLKLDPTKRKFTGRLMIKLDVDAYAAGPDAESSSPSTQDQSHNGANYQARPLRPARWRTSAPNLDSISRAREIDERSRYLTLHAGSNLIVREAYYVFTDAPGQVEIAATKIGVNLSSELLTLDFYPNYVSSGQGLLLLVYSGLVNEHDSAGLFVHKSHKVSHLFAAATAAAAAGHAHPSNTSAGTTFADVQKQIYGLATQLQPSFARTLFPLWDEPDLKARFSLKILLPFRGYTSISNMPIKRSSFLLSCTGDPLQEIEFQTTPLMSSYLLTLIIGHFDYIETESLNGCKLRVYFYSNCTTSVTNQLALQNNKSDPQQQRVLWAPSSMSRSRKSAQLALDVGRGSIDELENLLGVRYPLSKYDMIALRDFNNGGMENWGASVFHESYILYEGLPENASSLSSMVGVAPVPQLQHRRLSMMPLVVAHEAAHQWFGNLVTAKSWNFLWLNEGFAQYFMYELANKLFPDEHYWLMFVNENRRSALFHDELISSSRALETMPALESQPASNASSERNSSHHLEGTASPSPNPNAKSRQTINHLSIFDELTYDKGACLVRMLRALVGSRHFFKGLQHYLLKHSYGSVASQDLWVALEESSAFLAHESSQAWQLERVMASWLREDGFPLLELTASEDPERPETHYRLKLVQSRFTLMEISSLQGNSSSSGNGNITQGPLWSIPLAINSERLPELDSEMLASEWARPRRPHHAAKAQRHHQSAALLLTERSTSVLVPRAHFGAWFKLNFNATGHFRVHYVSPAREHGVSKRRAHLRAAGEQQPAKQPKVIDLLAQLREPIRSGKLNEIDRLNLADDLFAMVRAGRRRVSFYLGYLRRAYADETNYTVLKFIVDSLQAIRLALVSNVIEAPLGGSGQREQPAGSSNGTAGRLFDAFVQSYLTGLSGFSFETHCDLAHFLDASDSSNGIRNEGASLERNEARDSSSSSPSLSSNLRPDNSTQEAPPPLNINERRAGEEGVSGAGKTMSEQAGQLVCGTLLKFNHRRSLEAAWRLFERSGGLQANGTGPVTAPAAAAATVPPTGSASDNSATVAPTVATAGPSIQAHHNGNDHRDHQDHQHDFHDDAPASIKLTAKQSPPASQRHSPAADEQQNKQHQEEASSAGAQTSKQQQTLNLNAMSVPLLSLDPNLDRDLRASIYYAILVQAANDSAANETTPANNNGSINLTGLLMLRLLKLYATGSVNDANGRFAIVWALGAATQVAGREMRDKLLQLAIDAGSNHLIRYVDCAFLLESMARASRQNRQLMWQKIVEMPSEFESAGLLKVFLLAIQNGLIEAPGSNFAIENKLRHLYSVHASEHGKLISQTLELVKINTRWFERDAQNLIQFLNEPNYEDDSG